MGIKKYKPTSPGRRGMTTNDQTAVTTDKPYKKLVSFEHRTAGRNSFGRITSRFRGGGHKRLYRQIDWKRDKFGVPGTVATIEYDPNRTCYIALVNYADGDKRYILAPKDVQVGTKIISSRDADITPGNSLPLRAMPSGTEIHNIELIPGKGGQIVRSAGTAAQLLAKEGEYAQVRLPSGEVRRIHADCRATVGSLSNAEQSNINIGKAGRTRWLGRRPHNRGVTMNPVDHPMGGGEGRTSGGGHPRTPWGVPTKGLRTRKNKRTQVFIVTRRSK